MAIIRKDWNSLPLLRIFMIILTSHGRHECCQQGFNHDRSSLAGRNRLGTCNGCPHDSELRAAVLDIHATTEEADHHTRFDGSLLLPFRQQYPLRSDQ